MTPMPGAEVADPALSIDLRSVRAYLITDESDLVMILTDGDVAIALESGAGNARADAIAGATRVASVALQFAEMLNVRNGSRRPFVEPAELEAAASDPP